MVTFATVTGMRNGRLAQETDARRIHSGLIAGEVHSAIQITTAAGICAVLDLLSAGILPQRGFVRQEDVPFDVFLANRFGRRYVPQGAVDGASERLRDAA